MYSTYFVAARFAIGTTLVGNSSGIGLLGHSGLGHSRLLLHGGRGADNHGRALSHGLGLCVE